MKYLIVPMLLVSALASAESQVGTTTTSGMVATAHVDFMIIIPPHITPQGTNYNPKKNTPIKSCVQGICTITSP